MDLTLVVVPYDLGREGVGSGRGPAAYLEGGAAETLRARGHDVQVVIARRSAAFSSELEAVLEGLRVRGAALAGLPPTRGAARGRGRSSARPAHSS